MDTNKKFMEEIRDEWHRGVYWYRPPDDHPIETIIALGLAVALPLLFYGAKLGLEGKLKGSSQHKPTQQEEVYRVNKPCIPYKH